jgi:hypothetical protein
MIGLSLKYFSSGAKGAESHSSTVMLRSTMRMGVSPPAKRNCYIPPASGKVNASRAGEEGLSHHVVDDRVVIQPTIGNIEIFRNTSNGR